MHSPLLGRLAGLAGERGDKTFLVGVDGTEVSFGSTWLNVRMAAAFLRSLGVGPGDRIMLSAEKDIEFIYLYFAAHLIGAVNVVVDAKNNAGNIGYISSVTTPKLAFGMATDGVRCIQYADIDLSNFEPYEYSQGNLKPTDTADIMFTSGTTGKPKGVVLSHYNIYSSASNINGFIGNDASDIELLGLPICHSFGLGRIRCNLLTGATVVLHNGFANLKSVFNAIEKYHVSGFGMVPAVWAYIKRFSGTRISKYAPQIKYIEIGSAAMPREDKELLSQIFPDTRICMHYGLTEASRSLFMEFHECADRLDTAGLPVSDRVTAIIADADGNELPAGEEGEICIKGNMVTSTYLDPSDNETAYTPDGFFRTGDWGYRDPEGYFYMVSRKKELINVGGKKVSPVEIETALEHLGVGECMAIAVPDPDGILGEVPKVLLVKGTFTKPIEEIQAELPAKLETYKLPKFYEVVDSIPKTASGKKKRTNVETHDK